MFRPRSYSNKEERDKGTITHVCVPATIYALLQYMLLFDDDIVFHHTHYFLTDTSTRLVCKKLKATYFKTTFTKDWKGRIERKFAKLTYIFERRKYPFLKTAKLYANGHTATYWLGRRSYSLLADAPDFLTHNMNVDSLEYQRQRRRSKTLQGKLEMLIYGKPVVCFLGNNDQCEEVYLTEPNISPVLQGKKVHIDTLQHLWEKASDYKKQFIMEMFDLDSEVYALLLSKKIWFFSQPFTTDAQMTEEEYRDLLKKIIERYGEDKLLIKLHPRDKFDYGRYFPNIAKMSKPVNIQLLTLNKILPEKAVAICTGAVDCLPESVQLDWYGATAHPKILRFFGDQLIPQRAYNSVNI